MFLTLDAFKMPLEVDSGRFAWSLVELMTVSPVLLVTYRKPGRNFDTALLMSGDQELLAVMREVPRGSVSAVHVLFPPRWSSSSGWEVLPVRKLESKARTDDMPLETVVLTLGDGVRYTGFPLSLVRGDMGQLTLLAEFPEQGRDH
jgi:hypothetical protein